jgi:hypothetical protein
MRVFTLDPIGDRRWHEFVRRHPAASVFHAPAWVYALRRTYGYDPVFFTTTPPGETLTNGLIACRVRSWLTGRRLVAVPFDVLARPRCSGAHPESASAHSEGARGVPAKRPADCSRQVSVSTPRMRPLRI